MINIVHVLPDLGTGGAEKMVYNLLKQRDYTTFNYVIISLYNRRNCIISDELRKIEIEIVYLNKRKGIDISIIYKLYRQLCKIKPDVIHTHRYILKYVFMPAFILKIPIIHTIHNMPNKESHMGDLKINNILYKRSNVQVIALSKKLKRETEQLYKIDNVRYVCNGIEMKEKTLINKESLRKKYNINKDTNIIINVARMEPQKNHYLLLEVFKQIEEIKGNCILVLVGNGSVCNQIKRYCNSIQLDKKVLFMGIRKDIQNLMLMSDCFLLTSKWEGMPLVVLEAMYYGVPVVSTNVGAIEEVIEDKNNGYLCLPNDTKCLINSVLKVLNRSKESNVIIENAQATIKKKFSSSSMAYNYEKLYKKISGYEK